MCDSQIYADDQGREVHAVHAAAAVSTAEDATGAHALDGYPATEQGDAAIYQVDTGRELRVAYGAPDNLVDSLLSRTGDVPLITRATDLLTVLEEKGWTVSASNAGM